MWSHHPFLPAHLASSFSHPPKSLIPPSLWSVSFCIPVPQPLWQDHLVAADGFSYYRCGALNDDHRRTGMWFTRTHTQWSANGLMIAPAILCPAFAHFVFPLFPGKLCVMFCQAACTIILHLTQRILQYCHFVVRKIAGYKPTLYVHMYQMPTWAEKQLYSIAALHINVHTST